MEPKVYTFTIPPVEKKRLKTKHADSQTDLKKIQSVGSLTDRVEKSDREQQMSDH